MANIGIPTQYKNHNFRSRLEARWASFFDLLEWQWEYEPVDFNGWIPDFAIYGADIIYVEIKLVVTFPEDVAQKIEKSGCDKEVLILGQTVPITNEDSGPSFGWIGEFIPSENGGRWVDATEINRWYIACFSRGYNVGNKIGFGAHNSIFHNDKITRSYAFYHNVTEDEIQPLWAEAGNKAQWKPVA